jgi:hypothetical protein
MLPLSLVFLILAAVTAIVSRILSRIAPERKLVFTSDNSILVCVVSYKDTRWIHQCVDLLKSAHAPSLVKIGVVEYVRNIGSSREKSLPPFLKENVKIHTLSSVMADTTQEARKVCMDNLFSGERFVLFTRAVQMRRGWDSFFLSKCRKHVVCSSLPPETEAPTFPSVKRVRDGVLEVQQRKVQGGGAEKSCVPSILWQSEFSFSSSDAAGHIVGKRSDADVTASLSSSKFSIRVPCLPFGKRGVIPHGVRKPTNRISDESAPYFTSIGVSLSSVGPEAYLGLTKTSSPSEHVMKYGSVAGARISLQNESVMSR